MSKDKKDLKAYYSVLGLEPGASRDDIRQAYKQLAKERHPDRNPGDPNAMQAFLELKEAHDVLIKRKDTAKVASAVEEGARQLRESEKAKFGAKMVAAMLLGTVAVLMVSFMAYSMYRGGALTKTQKLERSGQYAEAAEVIHKHLPSLQPGGARKSSWVGRLAGIHVRLGDLQAAEQVLMTQLDETGDDAHALALLGDVFVLQGKHKNAVRAYAQALEYAGTPELRARHACALLRMRRLKQANRILDELAADGGEYSVWARSLRLARMRKPAEALKLDHPNRSVGDFVEFSTLGFLFIEAGKARDGVEKYGYAVGKAAAKDLSADTFGVFYRSALSEGDRDYEILPRMAAEHQRSAVLVGLGDALTSLLEFDEATGDKGPYVAAEILDPSWVVPPFRSGLSHYIAARSIPHKDGAEAKFRKALAIDPDYHLAMMYLAKLYAAYDGPDVALQLMDEVLTVVPDNARFHMTRAEIAGHDGNTRAEIRGYKRALKLDPGLGRARIKIAEVHFSQGRYRAGMLELKKAARDPDVAHDAWAMTGKRAFQRENPDCRLAARAYQKVREQDPYGEDAIYTLMCCYSILGLGDKARSLLTEAEQNGYNGSRSCGQNR